MQFGQWTMVGKFKNGLNDLANILPRCSSVSLPKLYGLRKKNDVAPPPPSGYQHLHKLRLNADALSSIPSQYLQ